MNTLRILLPWMVTSILSSDSDFVRHDDTIRQVVTTPRHRISLQALQLDVVHHLFLALGECQVGGNGVCAGRPATIPAAGLAAAATDGPEASWRFVCLLGRAQHTAAQRPEPRLQEGEYHGEIGRDNRDEGLPGAPCASKLCTVDRVLWTTGYESEKGSHLREKKQRQ